MAFIKCSGGKKDEIQLVYHLTRNQVKTNSMVVYYYPLTGKMSYKVNETQLDLIENQSCIRHYFFL